MSHRVELVHPRPGGLHCLRALSKEDSSSVAAPPLQPGLYEALLTGALDKRLADVVGSAVASELRALADADAADRVAPPRSRTTAVRNLAAQARRLGRNARRAINARPEGRR